MQTVIEFMRGISNGGAETLVKDYALLLDKNKFNVKIVVLFDGKRSANSKILKKNNIPIIEIYKNWGTRIAIFNKIFGKWYVPICLKRIIKQEKPTVVHAHMTVLKYLPPLGKYLEKVRLFYTCHSLPERYFKGAQLIEYKAANKLIKKNGMRMIGLHEDMVKELNDLFGVNNSMVIHNGIDFRRFQNLELSKEEMREKLGIPNNAFVVGHVGRFHKIKNHCFLVDVFEEVCRKNRNSYLLLIGDGEEKANIELLLKEKKLYSKTIILSNRSDVPELMNAMDVFVFPSIAEGLGIAVVEAQVSGLRCIVSDSVPVAAFLTDLAIPVSLNEPVDYWADIILNKTIKGQYKGNVNDYDMNLEIKRLESLYLGE